MVDTEISYLGVGSESKKIQHVEITQSRKKFHYKIFRQPIRIKSGVYNPQICKEHPLDISVVGEYFSKASYPKEHVEDDLSKDILLNKKKEKDSDVAQRLSLLMYCVAEENFPEIFESDIISPVPNTTYNEFDAKGPALSKQLFSRLKINNYHIVHHELLNKTKSPHLKPIFPNQKIDFFKNNRIYEFDKTFNIQDKTILLIDDVITLGCTTNQCLEELYNNGAKNVYIYAVAKNHFKE